MTAAGSHSLQQFSLDILAFARKTRLNVDLVKRKICLDVFRSLVMKSPVDTGRFRGNWQIGVGSVNTDVGSQVDKSGSNAVTGAMGIIESTVKAGQIVYLTNSLPYAVRLEYGWSKQAPQGMVRLTVAEYRAMMDNVIRSL